MTRRNPARTLVLLPGMLNDADLWRDQIRDLGDIAACQVGDITKGATLREIARDILRAAPEHFALAGFSLGGFVAQEIIRTSPERVCALALLDTSLRSDTPQRREERLALNHVATMPGRFIGLGDRMLTRYLAPHNIENPDIVGRIRAMCERLGPDVFVRQNSLERPDGQNALRGFDKPVLILCGEHDKLTPPALHREMLGLAPQGTLTLIPGSGHMTPLEAPGAVSAALRGWLQAIPA